MADSFSGLRRSHRCAEVTKDQVGEIVTLMGWVQKRRNLGSIIFVDLRDRTGLMQLLFDEINVGEDGFQKAQTIRNEFVLAVRGLVQLREGAVNEALKTGEIEIKVLEFWILSEALTPPFPIEENSQVKDDLRLKYRYLDLRRPDLQRNLIFRSKLAKSVRDFMSSEGFLEIETPFLTKSTPEGARDYLVPSRVHPGSFYALPQSPQLFKQLLMCAGYDRYYQIVKCFRDEDLRADRQPEFTQIDMEFAFADQDEVMELNERLLAHTFKEMLDIDIELPIRRMAWSEAMDRFGTDKPDMRFGMIIQEITSAVKNSEFKVFSDCAVPGKSVRGFLVKGEAAMPRKKIDALTEFAKENGLKGLAYLGLNEDGTYKSSFAKFMSEDELSEIVSQMRAEAGDIMFFAADEDMTVLCALGALRLKLAKDLNLIPEGEFKFVWITEFPLLEYSEEEGRFVAMHHPFTMPKEEDLDLLDSDPGKVRANAYDIVLNGTEIGGGSERIYNPEIQERMFEALGFSKEEANERFGFLIDAFKYGVPPHAGLAYGFDRLCMIMCGVDSIRDVIAFPKVKDASCLMTEAPSEVDKKQLDELGIAVKS